MRCLVILGSFLAAVVIIGFMAATGPEVAVVFPISGKSYGAFLLNNPSGGWW